MTINPAAEKAGQAAELAVEHAEEEQETREAASAALANSENAAFESEVAISVADEALANAENAGNVAVVSGAIASEAAETASTADAKAEEAKSEVAELREFVAGQFDQMADLLRGPAEEEHSEDEVTEVETSGLNDSGTGAGVSDNKGTGNGNVSGGNDGTAGHTGPDSAGGKAQTSTSKKARGFNRGRRRSG